MNADAVQRTVRRQANLVCTLRQVAFDVRQAQASGLVAVGRGGESAAWQAYRGNGWAIAHRALRAAYPTLAQMVGDEAMHALARDMWSQHAPARGDLALWGEALPSWLALLPSLGGEHPALVDVARLDWAVHRTSTAADGEPGLQGLTCLGQAPATRLRLSAIGPLSLIPSRYPIAKLWRLHRGALPPDALAEEVRHLLTGPPASSETALVWRAGWSVEVCALTEAEARFTQGLLDGASLEAALQIGANGAPPLNFEHWLSLAARDAWPLRWTIDGPEPCEEAPDDGSP